MKDGPNNEPIIFNPTYGIKILCESIIKVIAVEAFENNSFPLIIGLNV